MYILIAAAVVLLDQITKYIAVMQLSSGGSIELIDGFFSLTYLENFGAAFGMFQNMQILTVLLPILLTVAGIVLMTAFKHKIGPIGLWALALITAGGTGNIIDRIFRGYVIDFLDFHIWSPIFNFADVSVCVGCGLLILYVLVYDSGDRRQ